MYSVPKDLVNNCKLRRLDRCRNDLGYEGSRIIEIELVRLFSYRQSDVEAPPYVPAYLRNKNFKSGYTKTGYSGTKTGYSGTKTGYAGTKTGYAGTKTGYAGTKTGYAGTKNGYSPYGEKRTWDTSYGHGLV